MAAKKTFSLHDLQQRVRALDKLVTDAWFDGKHPAAISFREVREHAAAISALVAGDAPTSSPKAATATQPPKAADTDKSTAKQRAEYQRAAADKAPRFDPAILGLAHVRKS